MSGKIGVKVIKIKTLSKISESFAKNEQKLRTSIDITLVFAQNQWTIKEISEFK